MKLITAIAIVLFSYSIYSQDATVIKVKANLRGTASERGKVIRALSMHEVVEVITTKGAWYLVQSIDYVGWIHGNAIRLGSSGDNTSGDSQFLPNGVILVPTDRPARKSKELVESKPVEPYIGMTTYEAVKSTWGITYDIRRSETARGTTEMWFYQYNRSLFFVNGRLTQISR